MNNMTYVAFLKTEEGATDYTKSSFFHKTQKKFTKTLTKKGFKIICVVEFWEVEAVKLEEGYGKERFPDKVIEFIKNTEVFHY